MNFCEKVLDRIKKAPVISVDYNVSLFRNDKIKAFYTVGELWVSDENIFYKNVKVPLSFNEIKTVYESTQTRYNILQEEKITSKLIEDQKILDEL